MRQEFKYAISYLCESQEEQDDIVQYLNKVGYEDASISPYFNTRPYIVTRFGRCLDKFGRNQSSGEEESKQEKIQSKELFLALACCSNTEEGIEGEYWKCIVKANDFTMGKLYQATCSLRSGGCFIDDGGNKNGFPNYRSNLANFVKATREEIEAFILPQAEQTVKQSVTISQEKLFQYIQSAKKEKTNVFLLLEKEFPDLWKQEFVVTKEFYNKVVKEIGNCPKWVEILKQDFKKFHVLQYKFVEGEEVFASDDCNVFWTICKYHHTLNNKHYVNRLDNSISVCTYSTTIPVKAVFPQYPYPQLGIHY